MESKTDPRIGERVELSPSTDLWMRGARFGTFLGWATNRSTGTLRGWRKRAGAPNGAIYHAEGCRGHYPSEMPR